MNAGCVLFLQLLFVFSCLRMAIYELSDDQGDCLEVLGGEGTGRRARK